MSAGSPAAVSPEGTRPVGNVIEGFAAVVARHADRTAVSCGERQLTYRELDQASTTLAAAIHLRAPEAEGRTQRPVAILLDRSAGQVVAALAVLKTGAYYLPLDSATPTARLHHIIGDAAPSLVLTSRALTDLLPGDVPVLPVDDLGRPDAGSGHTASGCPAASITLDDPAYLIFTSGTTGRPKGVLVSHANLLRLFTSTASVFGFGCEDVWCLFHSFAFDFSVWEMWGALLHGGRLVVVPEQTTRDPAAFRRLVAEQRVSVLNQTPTAFAQFSTADAGCEDRLRLRWVVFGGERLHFPELRLWVARYGDQAPGLVNMYGITETTVHASYRRIGRDEVAERRSLIGHPLPDLDFILVDEKLRPVAEGDPGEIVVTGAGVSLGYLGAPELTRDRFVELTDRHGRPVRGYRSGDLAVRTPSGEYEYRGRTDDQVKIRGFRIELGEIRAALSGAPGVRQAAVLVREPAAGPVVKQRAVSTRVTAVRDLVRGGQPGSGRPDRRAQIIGYVVPGPGFTAEQLFAHLRRHLPRYMIPAFIVGVDTVPLNRNGKVDPARLPQPSAATIVREFPAAVGPDGADGGAGVRTVCALFEEVLGVDEVGEDDSFFSVGGDSILALKLRAAGLDRGVSLELSDIYALQTPRALAAAEPPDAEDSTVPSAPVEPFSLIGRADRDSLPSGEIEDAYPIGTLQAGLLFHSAYAADTTMYCDIFMFRFGVAYHHEAMEQAVARAVARHDILRTSFHFSGFSEPLQLVHRTARCPLTVVDLRQLPPAAQDEELAAWRSREMVTGYDVRRPPLLRFTMHVLGAQEFQLALSFHDALLDGWSESSLITEILTDYDGLRQGAFQPPKPRPNRRYADFVAVERAVLRSEPIRRFWSDELDGAEPTVLPRLVPETGTAAVGFLSVDLDPELTEVLDQLARAQRVSLKHLLLAVHARVVCTLTGQGEVILGVESGGRVEDSDGTEVIGTHLNVVPHRLAARGRTWRELIAAAWAKENELLAMRRYPYAELQRLLGVRELTDISFNYTHFHSYQQLTMAQLAVLDATAYIRTHFTLRVEFNKDPFTGLLTLDLEADLGRVGEDQLRSIGELYRNALGSVAADAAAVPVQRDLLGEPRYQALLAGSRGACEPPQDSGFFPIFDRAVATHPGSPAACCGTEMLSYRDLAARAGWLAGWLRRAGVGPGATVGLAAARGLDFLTAVLAIMRTGAVYLPLPAGPGGRVAAMLRRSGAGLVLCDHAGRQMLAEAANEVTVTDLAAALADAGQQQRPDTGPVPGGREPAYVIFTSGSTGEPKGALIRHDGMDNHLQAKVATLDLGPGDRVGQDAAATFDISVWQMLAPLMVGACTVIYPDEISRDPARLLRAVGTDAVTVLEVSPSVLSVLTGELVHYGLAALPTFGLRWVVCSGETLTPRVAGAFRRALPGVRMLNMWGATEVSDDCTHHELDGDDPLGDGPPGPGHSASVPIGHPIRNTAVYVLDDHQEPVPLGTPGELYVGGVCVGAGYVHDPQRSALAFLPDPFGDEPGALLYRTGDRGRRRADGRLEFLGRRDRQVKVRGHRVELGEVERALAGLDDLQDSVVVVRPAQDGTGVRLAAFVVPTRRRADPAPGFDLAPAALRARLARILPRYAIPDLLIQLSELPRTAHGKVDTKALAGWDLSSLGRGTVPDQAIPPQQPLSPTETAVTEVWEAILAMGRFDSDTHFFEIGGHSLHATQVMARLQDRLGVHLPLRTIFEHPTVRELATEIDLAARTDGAAGPRQPGLPPIPRRGAGPAEFPLALNQAGLWFLHQLDSTDAAYENGTLLRIRGPLDVEALSFAVDTVAGRHEILSTRFGVRRGVPFQTVLPDTRIRLEIETVPDGARLATAEPDMTAYVRDRMVPGRFDLEHGPLVIVRLYRFTPTAHILDWSSHHIVSDGWSTNVIVAEIRESYLAHRQQRAPELPGLPVQYGDFAHWQQQFMHSEHAAREVGFWSSYLDGYPGELDLPTDAERTDRRSRTAGYVTRTWDETFHRRLGTFAGDRRSTPFLLFHAVTSVVIAKFAQQSDVVLGAAVAGRSLPETENLVGFFAHVLPLRYRVDLAGSPEQVLASTTSAALAALEHQHLPVQEIVRAMGVQRRPGHSPLIQVLVTVDNYPLDLATLPDLTVDIDITRTSHSLFDLMFGFLEKDGLELTIQYDSALFTADTAHRLLQACARLLDFFLEQPQRSLRTAVLLDEPDRAALEGIWRELTGAHLDLGGPAAETLLTSPHWPALVDRVEACGLLPALLMAL